MGGKETDVINGFNSFLKEQKNVPGEARLSLILFDTVYTKVYENINIRDVVDLDKSKYRPGGMTALLDAVGTAIDTKGKFLDKLSEDEKPEQVIVVIITDGAENSSTEYKKKSVKEAIEHQQNKYNWKFIFLGADQNAFAEAGSIGISNAFTSNYSNSEKGISKSYSCLSNAVRSMREGDFSAAQDSFADLNNSTE